MDGLEYLTQGWVIIDGGVGMEGLLCSMEMGGLMVGESGNDCV